MKIAVKVGQTVEALGASVWRQQVAQVDLGGEFPEKVKILLGEGNAPLAPGEYTVELARAVRSQNVIVDGKAGRKVARPMLVIDIRGEDLVAVAKPAARALAG